MFRNRSLVESRECRVLTDAMSSGKRKLEEDEEAPRNETGKALFVRDMKGELVTVLPGQLMPTKVSAATEESRSFSVRTGPTSSVKPCTGVSPRVQPSHWSMYSVSGMSAPSPSSVTSGKVTSL